jgi:hypothetical protein
MRRHKCRECKTGILKTIDVIKDADGAVYRKKVCEGCGKLTYTKETPINQYDFRAARTEYERIKRLERGREGGR